MIQVRNAVKEKCSYWLEWRAMSPGYYATMQVEEANSEVSRSNKCVKRYRLTEAQSRLPLLELMRMFPRIYVPPVRYHERVTFPIRDTLNDGIPTNMMVTIYGLTPSDICATPSGSDILVAAITRLGLDPHRYQCFLMDATKCESHNYTPEIRK